jgi:mitochondrial fission protein ELM1
MNKSSSIWVLTDKMAGNANQARSLAKLMDWKSTEHSLTYSILSNSPNFIPFGLCRLSQKSRKELLNCPAPQIIISSGRRTAAIALAIKAIYPMVKIVQIMNPELPFKNFQAIILPHHDKNSSLQKHKHIVWTDGAVSYVDRKILAKEEATLRKHYKLEKKKNICSLIIGGSTGRYSINKTNIDEIMGFAVKFAQNNDAVLMISTSRRTDPNIVKYLRSIISKIDKVKIILYSYDPKSDYNPYWGMIAASERIITTADSISMPSEILSCGKMLYLYGRSNMASKKHMLHMKYLIDNGLAKNLAFGMPFFTPKTDDKYKKLVNSLNKLL